MPLRKKNVIQKADLMQFCFISFKLHICSHVGKMNMYSYDRHTT